MTLDDPLKSVFAVGLLITGALQLIVVAVGGTVPATPALDGLLFLTAGVAILTTVRVE